MATHFGPRYLDLALNDPEIILRRAQHTLVGLRFDTMVGTGLSGGLVVPHLARAMGKQWLLVRKPEETNHDPGLLVGDLGSRWLFVDDMVSSGATLRRVQETVQKAVDARREFDPDEKPPLNGRCVGAWLYRDNILHRNHSRGPLKIGNVNVWEKA